MPKLTLITTRRCDHRCWYCCSGPAYNESPLSIIDEIGVDKYLDALMRMVGDCHPVEFRLSGGEPTQHPAFPELLDKFLDQGHYVTIGTNGLNAEIVDRVVGNRNDHLWYEASFHLGQYLKDPNPARLEKYLTKCFPLMIRHCQRLHMITPATPDVLFSPDLEIYYDYFKRAAKDVGTPLSFNLEVLYGPGPNGKYPRAYTEEEKLRLVELKLKYESEPSDSWLHRPSFTMDDLNNLLKINRAMHLKGWPCYYMTSLVSVDVNGLVEVCGSGFNRFGLSPREGDLRRPDKLPHLGTSLAPCKFETCNCVSMGSYACLRPNGVTYEQYLSNTGPPKQVEALLSNSIKRLLPHIPVGLKRLMHNFV